MVSSGYSDLQNVDLGTNLTKSVQKYTMPVFFLPDHSRRFLTIRTVLGDDITAPRGQGRSLRVILKLLESSNMQLPNRSNPGRPEAAQT